MSLLEDTFVSPAAYNSLPYLQEVYENDPKDLSDLRGIIAKHNVPPRVLPSSSSTSTSTQTKTKSWPSSHASKFKGLCFFIDVGGLFQAYENTTASNVVDMSKHQDPPQ
ncbi:hypothetical protein B0T14DRAFT_563871 [Immersiella caudata]|uniref:Uncharacterized protein n=1 Tax=Immersiella caudata TaxID=314043 RepID=A0AA39WVK5_9PEZI|nr:hypothetical protein B0T14DRAFT_563871 [Immersiella caudata]